jgi:hypothetical protein
MAISPTNIQILFTNYDIITYFLNLASCSEHFTSIKHRILATFNINKKNQSERLYAFNISFNSQGIIFLFNLKIKNGHDGTKILFKVVLVTHNIWPIWYDLNLTRGCHRFYYLAPFTVFDSFSHPFLLCQYLFTFCVVWCINLLTVSQDQNAT